MMKWNELKKKKLESGDDCDLGTTNNGWVY